MQAKKKIEKVSKPYLKGDAIDRTTVSGGVKHFVGTIVMAIAYLVIGVMMNWDQVWLNVLVNTTILLATYMMFAQFGMNAGADAVNQGEIMFARQEKGRPVAEWERSMCYHPLKGFISALIGAVPVLLCSIILACIAERQMTSLGALPSWVSGFESRQEIGNALAIYHEAGSMSLETVMRMLVRMTVMPFVNMVGPENKDAMLLLERVSPLINLIPVVAYGLGYINGVDVRTSIHTNIALGKKKAKRKQAKERRARRQARGPEQLN